MGGAVVLEEDHQHEQRDSDVVGVISKVKVQIFSLTVNKADKMAGAMPFRSPGKEMPKLKTYQALTCNPENVLEIKVKR
jgi:GTP-binding protein EngB required for normal cell division